MVAPYADSLTDAEGLSDAALSDMPLDATAEMPAGDDDAASDDTGALDAAASDASAVPFDRDALTPEQREYLDGLYRSEYEARFAQDKANLQRALSQQITQWRQQAEQAHAERAALIAGLQAKDAWVQQYFAQQGDELGFYKYRDQTGAAPQQVMAQQSLVRDQADSFVHYQLMRHQQAMERESVDEEGQRLFDADDPEIYQALVTFAELAHRDQLTQQSNPQLNAQAVAAWERYRAVVERKKREGIRRTTEAKVLTQKAQKAKQSQEAIARRKARGPVATGLGNRGDSPTKPLDELAWEKFPEPNQQEERLRFIQERYAALR